jgi:hypothetical protein
MTSHISQRKTGFRLPLDVSEKQRLSDAWAYSSGIVCWAN